MAYGLRRNGTITTGSMVGYWNYLRSAKSKDLRMVWQMPDESCRRCGGELAKFLWCTQCRKTIQKICRTCSSETSKQHHVSCLLPGVGCARAAAMAG